MSLTVLSSLDLVHANLARHLSVKSFNLLNRTCKPLNEVFKQVPFTSIEHGRLLYLNLANIFKTTGDAKLSVANHYINDRTEEWTRTLSVPLSLQPEIVIEGYREISLVWHKVNHSFMIEFIDQMLPDEVDICQAYNMRDDPPSNTITNRVSWEFCVKPDGSGWEEKRGWGDFGETYLETFDDVWKLVVSGELATIPLINDLDKYNE